MKGRVALAAASGAPVVGLAVSTVVEPVKGRTAVVGVVFEAATPGAAVDGGVLFDVWGGPVVLVVVVLVEVVLVLLLVVVVDGQ